MAALTRNTDRLQRDGEQIIAGVKAATHIRAGAWVRYDGDYVNNLTPAVGDVVAGVALDEGDNTATGAADGDVSIRVSRGRVYHFAAVSGHVPARGQKTYAADNDTVTRTVGSTPVIGITIDADADGVWVEHIPGITA